MSPYSRLEPIYTLAQAALFGPPRERPRAIDTIEGWLSAAALSGLDGTPLGSRLAVIAEHTLAEDRTRRIAVLTAWDGLLKATEAAGQMEDLRVLWDVHLLVSMGGAKDVARAFAPIVEPIRDALRTASERELPGTPPTAPRIEVHPRECGICESGRVERLIGGDPARPVQRACSICHDDINAGVDVWELRRPAGEGERWGRLLGTLSAREYDQADAKSLAVTLAALTDEEAEVVIDLVEDYGAWPDSTAAAAKLAAEADNPAACPGAAYLATNRADLPGGGR